MGDKNGSWRVAAEQRRAALEALGIAMPRCLSGESGECGADDIGHFAAFTATLMAQTQWDMAVMERACPGQGTSSLTAEVFAEQCHELRPEGFECAELGLRDHFDALLAAVEEEHE